MNVEQRNRAALAFIQGRCSACKDCLKSKDCVMWLLEQILLGKPWSYCEYCGETCLPEEGEDGVYMCAKCAKEYPEWEEYE